jgi:hypothetical protein
MVLAISFSSYGRPVVSRFVAVDCRTTRASLATTAAMVVLVDPFRY